MLPAEIIDAKRIVLLLVILIITMPHSVNFPVTMILVIVLIQ